jgi:acyl carrier protein
MAEQVMALDWPRTSALRILLTGADTLRHYPAPELPFKVVNNYGPTECTVVATSGAVDIEKRPAALPAIGRPISGTQVYILDEKMQPVRGDKPGEMYIGGAGVARGYRHRPDLTAQQFIPNPFSADPGARLYKTGDLARFLPDGQIAFMGRNDEQVKIRGYRIEPSEIVTALDHHSAVRESVVVAHDFAPEDRRLVAYLVLSGGANLTRTAVRDFLATHLPEHMIPAMFVRLDALPLNAHGKIDRSALPEPNAATTLRDEVFIAPRNPVEQKVAKIVGSLLQLDRIGVEENFFMLGGHSLLGTQIIARLQESFEVELPLRSLFDAPTIQSLAAEIEKLLTANLGVTRERRSAGSSQPATASMGES